MANRSYLYSSDYYPMQKDGEKSRQGLSEYPYDIPLAFKILLSGNPSACLSSIWSHPDQIAIVGDYAAGLKTLADFLDRIKLDQAADDIVKTLSFLRDGSNKKQYIILEAGEIFELEGDNYQQLNQQLLESIVNREGFDQNIQQENLNALGIQYWSNILYYDLR